MKKSIAIILFGMISSAVHAQDVPVQSLDDGTNWHLLTQSEGGVVSILGNLTEQECKTAIERTSPAYNHCGGQFAGCSWTVSPGDIKSAQCFK